jgi:branched-chain amino acid aminotransferase
VEPGTQPSIEETRFGVKVKTIQMQRDNPLSKSTDFISSAEQIRSAFEKDINEVLMVDSGGNILEGLSSNFFAVSSGVISTAGEGVLHGITREILLDVIIVLRIPLKFQAINLANINTIQEAFLTSTSRGVLGVNKIDHNFLPQPVPGEITHRIAFEFNRRVEAELEVL